MADWKKVAMAVGTSSQYIKGDGSLGNTSSIGGTDSTKLPLTGGTLTGDLIVEDSEVHVGDKSADSWTRIKHNGTDGYGFDWEHNNSTVLVNEQGSTNQALVLGDVGANSNSGLFGISHSSNTGSSWTKKLDLRGNGDLYIGSSGTSKVATESYVTSQGYLTSHQDISGKLNLSGGTMSGNLGLGTGASSNKITLGTTSWNNWYRLSSYWSEFSNNQNEGFKFINHGNTSQVQFQINNRNQSGTNGASAVTAYGDIYMNSNKKVATEAYVTSLGYTTNTGTTTASNSQTFTNKSGNISQWTNDSGYLTSHQDISGKANLSGASFTGHVNVGSSTPFLYVGDSTSNNDGTWDANIMLDSHTHSRIRIENRGNNRNLLLYSHSGTSQPHVSAVDSATLLYVGVIGSESYWDDNGRITTYGDGTSGNWKQAYDWGNHASAGYLTSVPNHSASLITSGTLPVARGGTGQTSGYNKSNWDTAYGWGNHASAGYISSLSGAVLTSGNQSISGIKSFTGGVSITGNAGGNASELIIGGSASPQIQLQDSDSSAHDFWMHANSNRFYILTDTNGSGSWNGSYPLELRNSDSTVRGYGSVLATQSYVTSQGYTTNTGTTTASNTQTFTNKSGNISQWTNDSGYLTSYTDTNTNQLTTWNLNGGNITTISHGETVTISGSGATSVSQSGNTITISSTDNNTIYSLPLASSSTRGGVKIGYTQNSKNYPVQLSSEKMYVNVPWTDSNTTYQAGTGLGLGGGYFYIADSGVTTAKINNDAVTQAKIADDAVGSAQLASNSVVSASISTNQPPTNNYFLRYEPTGSGLTWALPTDTNTTYSAGTGININGSNVISLATSFATEDYVDDEIDNLSDDIPSTATLKAQYGILGCASTTSSSGSKVLSTSYSAVSTTYYKVQFKAPQTGKVFIQAQVHQDAVSSGRYFYYEFHTTTPSSSSYSARHRIDETDDVNQTIGRVITGLTSGSTYTYYLYARLNATTGYLRWGSSYGRPYMIVTAINA